MTDRQMDNYSHSGLPVFGLWEVVSSCRRNPSNYNNSNSFAAYGSVDNSSAEQPCVEYMPSSRTLIRHKVGGGRGGRRLGGYRLLPLGPQRAGVTTANLILFTQTFLIAFFFIFGILS